MDEQHEQAAPGTKEYGEIGALLRRAREEVRLTPAQASRMLHIRVRYLEALEEGRLQELPGLTYTRGYLQAYASFLGLDKDEILRRFDEVANMLARRNFYFPQVLSGDKAPSQAMIWGGLGACLVLYLIWVFFLQGTTYKVSVVEPYPHPRSIMRFSGDSMRNVSCLREQDVLYPPCTTMREPGLELTPMRGWNISVMELAQPNQD